MQLDLELEKELHAQTRDMVEEKEQRLTEYRNHNEANLKDHKKALNDLRKLWKEAASEVLAENQGFFQVTDEELIHKAVQLRLNIRNFAYEQFGDEQRNARRSEPLWRYFKDYLNEASDPFETYVNASWRLPIMVGAFVWAVLQLKVFFVGPESPFLKP